jgi:hypothetical protein
VRSSAENLTGLQAKGNKIAAKAARDEADGATRGDDLVAKARRRGAVAAEADETAEEARDEADEAIK